MSVKIVADILSTRSSDIRDSRTNSADTQYAQDVAITAKHDQESFAVHHDRRYLVRKRLGGRGSVMDCVATV